MSKEIQLRAKLRKGSGRCSARASRQRGAIPGVVYGKTYKPTNIELDRREVEMALMHASGERLLVDLLLEVEKGQTRQLALIQEVQHHPYRNEILHVDLHAVAADESVDAKIPVEPVGEADGVKNYGGILEVIVRELPIRCLPKDLPDVLRIDVSKLGVGQSLHVRDLQLPSGVKCLLDGEVTVISVASPNVAASVQQQGEGQEQPEVLKEKKPAAEKKGEGK
ncbi:MAG: 50S ribosomal protein L25 [Chthoniobacterales bacterium]|nr:50S ribosomal protein L25 [Chthoniobacterales bacterium]